MPLPHAYLHKIANQSVPHDTSTPLRFPVTVKASGITIADLPGSFNFYADEAGLYLVAFNIRWALNTTGSRSITLYDATDSLDYSDLRLAASGLAVIPYSQVFLIPIPAFNLIEVFCRQMSGTPLNLEASTVSPAYMFIYKIPGFTL